MSQSLIFKELGMARNLSPKARENQTASQIAWHKENYERISIDVPKGKKAEYKAVAESQNKTLSKLIQELLENEIN